MRILFCVFYNYETSLVEMNNTFFIKYKKQRICNNPITAVLIMHLWWHFAIIRRDSTYTYLEKIVWNICNKNKSWLSFLFPGTVLCFCISDKKKKKMTADFPLENCKINNGFRDLFFRMILSVYSESKIIYITASSKKYCKQRKYI